MNAKYGRSLIDPIFSEAPSCWDPYMCVCARAYVP